MGVTYEVLCRLLPQWKNQNIMPWLGTARGIGDGSGGNNEFIFYLGSQQLFGGHWSFDVREFSIVTTAYQTNIYGYIRVNPCIRGMDNVSPWFDRHFTLSAEGANVGPSYGEIPAKPFGDFRWQPDYADPSFPNGPQINVVITNVDTKYTYITLAGFIYSRDKEEFFIPV